MTAFGLTSGTIRSSILILSDRQLARVWPFTYVVVGDSLATLCPWKWSFGLSPVAVANLAVSGSDIRGMTPSDRFGRPISASGHTNFGRTQ
jgi:hypothetical protein